jgi:hypothetical protein
LKNLALFLLLTFVCLCQSCSDEGPCTDDITCRVKAGFYVRDGDGERDTTVNGLTLYGLARPDSLIYDDAQGISNIEFPLPDKPESYSTYVFRIDSLVDTLFLLHHAHIVMVSFECGATVTHDVYYGFHGNAIFDTVAIIKQQINLSDEENLRIYLNPAVPDTAS